MKKDQNKDENTDSGKTGNTEKTTDDSILTEGEMNGI